MKKMFVFIMLLVCFVSSVAQNSDIKIGLDLYNKKEYKKAFPYLLNAANNGYASAQVIIGAMYQYQLGVDKDLNAAFNWYKKSAENGNIEGQCYLGYCYIEGNGVPKDESKAIYWIEKAANQGYAKAQYSMGFSYEKGIGVVQDNSKAAYWYQKAAEKGITEAQGSLGKFYYYGYGLQKDYSKAVYWFQKAADKGDSFSQHHLGFCYYNGEGVDKDNSKAIYWFQKAAEQGHKSSQRLLGDLYYEGEIVAKDYNKALDWYTKAAEQGDLSARNSLGWHYYIGDGFPQDYSKAEMWFKKAIEADASSPYPYSNLALLYSLRDKNYIEALGYSDIALEKIANLDPHTQAVFYGERGQIYVWKGDMENAEKMLAKCLELNPDYLKGDDEFSKMMTSYHSNEVDTKIITNPTINKNTFAIIIGNEKYKNEVDVPFANNDSKIFSQYVEKTLGVPHEQIKIIENAGYNDIRIAVNWLIQAMQVCRGKGKAIVYYAGHGIPNESDLSSYLLPVDGIGNDPGSAYSLKELYDKLGSVEAQSITIFLDACFSGSKRESGMLASARGVALKAKQSAPKGNMIIFTAAQGDETAYPYKDKQHGMFTYFLLKKLQETKGDVTLGALSDYLTEEVSRQSFIKNNKMQTPTVNVSMPLKDSWRKMTLK